MKREDEQVQDYINRLSRMIAEHVDSVVIICSHHDDRGTSYIEASCGNRHAMFGSVEEFLENSKAVYTKRFVDHNTKDEE